MLSIIIVNYNTGRLLKECIDSLYREATTVPFDIWVVDNDSHDNSITIIKQYYPQVNVIENRTNIGFAKANNLALSKCKTDYCLLLNPDTAVRDNAVEKVVRFMSRNAEVGIVGGRVLEINGLPYEQLVKWQKRTLLNLYLKNFRFIDCFKFFWKRRRAIYFAIKKKITSIGK